jgi:hypothetical protein
LVRVIFNRLSTARLWLVLVMLASLPFIAACKKSSVKLYPVKGKVLFKDQPAEGAQVVFQKVNPDPNAKLEMSHGRVGADGSFTLRTEPYGEGAPAGDYVVMVSWTVRDAKDELKTISKLPHKYADPTTPVLKATVKEGKNELEPFNLKP